MVTSCPSDRICSIIAPEHGAQHECSNTRAPGGSFVPPCRFAPSAPAPAPAPARRAPASPWCVSEPAGTSFAARPVPPSAAPAPGARVPGVWSPSSAYCWLCRRQASPYDRKRYRSRTAWLYLRACGGRYRYVAQVKRGQQKMGCGVSGGVYPRHRSVRKRQHSQAVTTGHVTRARTPRTHHSQRMDGVRTPAQQGSHQ